MTPSPLIVAWWRRYSPDNDHDDEEILDDIVMMKLMLMRLQKCGNTHVLLMYLITHGTVIQMKQMLMDF